MTQIPVRMNTQGMSFPLLSSQTGRTIIDTKGDLTHIPGVSTDGEVPEDRGVPGVIYAHNVMPSTYGWQAIGYEERIPAHSNADLTFTQRHLVQGATVSGDSKPQSSGLRAYIAVAAEEGVVESAKIYYIDDSSGEWAQAINSPTFKTNAKVSVAYVNGYTYIMVPNTGIYILDIAAGELKERELNAIDISAIEGVFSSNGYLLLWSARRVVWSSVVDTEDFEPSDVSGAGGGAIQEAAGAILKCVSSQLGYFVFTDTNAVSAVYTANEEFPFEYKEVPSAGGIYDSIQVSQEAVAGHHYAFTTNGIQRVAQSGATTQLSNVSDFIGGRVFEDLDEESNTLTQTILDWDMPRAIRAIGNRYILISYTGEQAGIFTHAIVIDVVQNRMGKLKINHVEAFEFRSLSPGTPLDSRGVIAFLNSDGKVSTVKFDLDCDNTEGVLILGKIQYVHQRMLQLEEVELENVCPSGNFTCIDIPSMDGRTFEDTINGFPNPLDEGKPLKRYFFSNVAKSHSLLFKGAFELLTILVWFNVHGQK